MTGRYTGSAESMMDSDIRFIKEKGFLNFLKENEESILSGTFWNITLPQNLETSSPSSPSFNVSLTAEINLNSNSFLMHGTNFQI